MTKKSFKNLLLCIPIGLVIFSGINNVGAEKMCNTTDIVNTGTKVTYTSGGRYGWFYRFKIGNKLALCLDSGLAMNDDLKYKKTTSRTLKNSAIVAKAYNYAVVNSGSNDKVKLAQIVVWAAEDGMSNNQILNALKSAFNAQGSFEKTRGDISSVVETEWNKIINGNAESIEIFEISDGASNYQALVSAKVTLEECDDELTYCDDINGNPINLTEQCLGYTGKEKEICISQKRDELCNFCEVNGQKIDIGECGTKDSPGYQACYDAKCTTKTYNCEINVASQFPVCKEDANDGYVIEGTVGNCEAGYRADSSENTIAGRPILNGSKSNYCRLYCLENIDVTYPTTDNLKLKIGSHIVWPNSLNDLETKIKANLTLYPLTFKASKKCTMYVNTTKLVEDFTDKKIWDILNDKDYNKYKDDALKLNPACETDAYKKAKKEKEDCEKNNCSKQLVEQWTANNKKYAVKETCEAEQNSVCTSVTDYQEVCDPSCNTERSAYEEQKEIYDACKKYLDAYNAAKKILDEFENSCAKPEIADKMKVETNYQVTYDDDEYGDNNNKTYDLKAASSAEFKQIENVELFGNNNDPTKVSTNGNTTYTLTDAISKVENLTIQYGESKTYNLKGNSEKGYYYYVDQVTNKSMHSNDKLKNYIKIGYSNLPISYNAKTNKDYKLTIISEILSGTSDEIKNEFNNKKYTCKYQVTNDPPDTDPCECPTGTINEGQVLDCYIAGYNNRVGSIETYGYTEETLTCPDAKVLLCNTESFKNTEYVCEREDYTCPDNRSIDMRKCINSGYSYDECAKYNCDIKVACPDDKDGTSSMSANFRDCVAIQRLRGMSLEKAKKACLDRCEEDGGAKIIYRTISLQNPFPSYDADDGNKNIPSGLKIGMFNDTVKGRYPGSNWNGVLTVKNKILNNRGVDGDAVYNKEPLYTIILDSTKIKAIREYNKNNSYSDFTLNCKKNNSTACISIFLRNTELNLITGGTCKNATKVDKFYKCDD